MDGAATEKRGPIGVLDLATVPGTVSCTCGMLLDLGSPAHRTPGYQVLKVARRVVTIEGRVHYSKYLVFDALVDWQPMEFA